MGRESNSVGSYSTRAADLGTPIAVDSDDVAAFSSTTDGLAVESPDVTVPKPPAVPQQTMRFNATAAQTPGGDPFRYDTSIPGENRIYLQQPSQRDENGEQQDPTLVRVAGDNGPVRYNVSASGSGVVGGGAAITTDDQNVSAAVTVSHNTNPGALNPTTIGANAYVLVPGTDVGAYAGITSNRLNDGEPGATSAEVGVIVTPGGRADNLQPSNSLIVGYRQRNAVSATGVETQTDQGFVRANAFRVGPVTTSGEVAADTGGVQLTLDATARVGPNTAVRVEVSGRTNPNSNPTGAAAFIIQHDL